MSDIIPFSGNRPKNVSKDAKYGIKNYRKGGLAVGLTYRADDGERWHMTTEAHSELAEKVSAVKATYGPSPYGPFYINEYKHVIVPVGDAGEYYLAGTYSPPLKFEFEGKTISGEPVDFLGRRLQPGDTWVGPHAGIPYVLAATGDDIYYRTWPRPNVEKRERLSDKRGKAAALQISRLLYAMKGAGGGRVYVNEFWAVFSPITDGDGLRYVYFGQIDPNSWFPDPVGTAAFAPT
jgi:hypothetical protein